MAFDGNEEEEDARYAEKMAELNRKLDDPKMKKKIDNWCRKIGEELNCSIEVFFDVHPEVDEYEEYIESEDFYVPRNMMTMTLGELLEHIDIEDHKYKIFVDPIFLKKGLNALNDVLMTTIDDNLILVPVSKKKSTDDNTEEENKEQ